MTKHTFDTTLETLANANELATKVIVAIAGEEISTHVNNEHYTQNVLRNTIAAGLQKALTRPNRTIRGAA